MKEAEAVVSETPSFSAERLALQRRSFLSLDRPTPSRRRMIVAFALVAGDVLAAVAAVNSVSLLGQIANATTPVLAATPFAVPLLLIVYFLMGLYTGTGPSPVERFRLRILGIILVVANIVVASIPPGLPIGSLIVAMCLGGFLAVFGFYTEFFIRRVLIQRGWWGAATAIVGLGDRSRELYRTLHAQPELGLRPIGFIETPEDQGKALGSLPAPVLGSFGNLKNAADKIELAIYGSTQQLAAANAAHGALPISQLVLVDDKAEIQSLRLRTRALDTAIGIEVKRDPLLSQNRWLKRALDLAIAVPLFVLTLPFMAVLAAAIKYFDPGDAIYVQTRVGLNGKPVDVFKLRSMFQDAKRRLEVHLANDPKARQEWERFFKLSNDPRILPVIGNFIRRSSLDELPQLWNVIRGDMSLVGPRPFPDYHAASFDPEFQEMRTTVPPGITGLWQVSARSDGDLAVQKAQDLYYIRNWSVWLDLYILFQTLPAVIGAKGAK